ncbi:uncharacterized protein EKO05_0007618 [Ascochyta rabiei]|uniref:Uncharacterized protein n=1 Tax=Didymella rabiei TaxID=5454 RepID=A0A163KWE6_DIDRA|nr:uncharacterized protein EKO05_0007618 [Ascochyta rabiei]KZM27301.1 hypothetical protein ST47_g1542 [Ascochyta rabiei]UPX17252.1 hypothetical protein EKO05_0007618 [Ascochyta rabiei]
MRAPRFRKEDPATSDASVTADEFLQLGWCTHQLQRLQRVCSPEALRYLSTLDRRGYRPSNHRACTEKPCCIANNVDPKNYHAAHTQTCSGACPPVAVDYNDVVNIINLGGVPIVSIHVDAASTQDSPLLSLKVTPRAISTRYTVISHVWFDGLGNPLANALPTCQLQRLHSQLLSMPPDHESGVFSVGSLQVDWSRQSFIRHPNRQPPLFWMDTLCIPVGEGHKHLRKTAINQMASIYAAAIQELVLDAELMQCEAGAGAALEMLARMACSAWMTRSWTLQEGVLARECVFQFKDRAIDPVHEWCLHGIRPSRATKAFAVSFPSPADEEHWAVYKELYNFLWDTLHQDWKSKYRRDPPAPARGLRQSHAAGRIHTLPAVHGLSKRSQNGLDEKDHFTMHLREEHRTKQLVDTWNELAHRSTTMPEDLHVIIANLLDFNADRIMDIPTREERMRAMILSFQSLPVSLFWNTGPKWRDGGNNLWMPVEPSKSELSVTPVMELSDGWLHLDLASEAVGDVSSARVFFIHEVGLDISVRLSFLCSGLSELVYDVTLLDAQNHNDGAASRSVLGEASYSLILATSAQSSITCSTRGALFRHLPLQGPEKEDIVQLSYCCPVVLHPRDTDLEPDEPHVVAEALATGMRISVKYDPIPDFIPYPRRLNRGPSMQGGVAFIILLPIPAVIGVYCLIAFIVIISRPPYTFTPVAQTLLTLFLVFFVGCSLLGFAWLLFIEAFMYRMWLASFDSDYCVEMERGGWWARYVSLERWLASVEHAVYTRGKESLEMLRRGFAPKAKSAFDEEGETGGIAMGRSSV